MDTATPGRQASVENDGVVILRPGWQQLVMVCQVCERRKKAPKKFGAKKVGRALSTALREARHPKTRIVHTSCMGLCPKQAVAVAAGVPGGSVRVIAWRKHDDPNAALSALLQVERDAGPVFDAIEP